MKMTVEIQNVTSTCHHVRLIPPSTSAFAIGPGKWLFFYFFSFTAFKIVTPKRSNLSA